MGGTSARAHGLNGDAIIGNGTVQLGVHALGHLNVPGGTASSGTGTTYVGLRYVPTNADVIAPGCLCEGWGVADAETGITGYANEASLPQVSGLAVESFASTASTAVSTVKVLDSSGSPAMRVTHDYHPSPSTANLYEITVTVENLRATAIADLRYRRVFDWDVEPTAFSDFVTIKGSSPRLLFSSDDGFASANPLAPRTNLGSVGPPTGGEFADAGPVDHGGLFDFGFGQLAAGATRTFSLYYGAAGTESDALAAVSAVDADVYSLGQPNFDNPLTAVHDGKELGKPNTFVFAASPGTLNLTVDETALPVGWDSLALSAFPASSLPFFAGPLSAPVGSTPVGSTPVGSTPVGSTPVGSTPVGSTPVGSTPVGSTPVGSTPVGSTGLLGTPVGSTPLRFVLASSLPLDWGPIVAGSALAGLPTQSFTLEDVANDTVAGPNFAAVKLSAASLEGTLLRGVSWASLLIGNKTVSEVPPFSIGWCALLTSCDGVTGSTTILGLDLAGRLASAPVGSTPVGSTPVGSTPVGSTKVGAIVGGLAGTPVGSTPVGSTHFADTRLGDVVIGAIGSPAGNTAAVAAVVDCALLGLNCLTKTLADAKAGGALKAGATLADLAPAIDHLTINELVIAVIGRAGLPWEALPIGDFAAYELPQSVAHYRLAFTVNCPSPTDLRATVKLPLHFILKPGTSRLTVGAQTSSIGDPETTSATGATWALGNVCPAGATSANAGLRFEALTGTAVGIQTSDVTLSGGGRVESAANQAPLLVQQRGEPDAEPVAIEPDRIYLRHIPTAGDRDLFKLPIPAANTVVRVFLGHLGGDLDLILQTPQKTLQSSPVGSTPVGSTAIEDRGTSIAGINPALPAEGLQDIPVGSTPVGSTPVGSTPVGSTSINRGTADEVVQVVSDGEEGFYTIGVSGYNGASSADGYTLRVQQVAPPALPPCPARTFTADSDPYGSGGQAEVPVALPAPASLPNGTKTLFLLLDNQLRDLYGSAAVDALLTPLRPPAAGILTHPDVQGTTLALDADPGVAAAIKALNAHPCGSPDDFVRSVNEALVPYRNALPNLKYLVFLGTNEAFPTGWMRDRVTLSNASDYAANLLFTTNGGTQANASYAAAFTGHVLTDDVYTSLTERPFLGESFPLPDLASGRLVETPDEMLGQLAQFTAANGQLDATTINTYTAAYDFLLDGGIAANSEFGAAFGVGKTLARLLDAANTPVLWDDAQVKTDFFESPTPAAVGAVWGHYDHFRMQPAQGALVSTESIDDAPGVRFPGRVIFTVGCNSGQNVADTLVQGLPTGLTSAQHARLRDWAQAWARQKTAVYIGNTSFGYGDTDDVALTEKLGQFFAGRLPEATSMGEKFVAVKQDYFAQMGTYGVYDAKALVEWTLYGLPQWRLSAGTAPAPAPAPASTTDAETGLQSVALALDSAPPAPELAKVQHDTDRGTFWSAADGATHSQPYRQPQAVHVFDQTLSGHELRGALIEDISTGDVSVANPHLLTPIVDSGVHEPERTGLTQATFFPANVVTVTETGNRSIVTVVDSQQRPTEPPSESVVTRLVDRLGLKLLYAPDGATDGDAPLFLETGLTRAGTQLTLFARVSGNPVVVKALVTQGETWTLVPLSNVPGTDVWRSTLTVADRDVDGFFEAANGFGRVAYTTAKGALLTSVPPPPAESLSILVEQPLEGALYTPNQPVNALYGCRGSLLVRCAGPVASGALVDTVTEGTKTFSVNAEDATGNTASATRTFKVDGTAPNPLTLRPDRPLSFAGGGGWYKTKIVVTFEENGDAPLADATPGSGVVASTLSSPVTFDTSGVHTASGRVEDRAGNVRVTTRDFQVDATPPEVSFLSCPATVLRTSVGALTWAASDAHSGLAAETGTTPLETGTAGTHTVTATVTDNVGLAATATCTYSVVLYDFTGVFSPVDNPPTVNVVSAGRGVPVKFSLHGNQGLSVFATGYPTSRVTACDFSSTSSQIEETVTAGSSQLSYDATKDQYIYVWKTQPGWAGSCRLLTVRLADGTDHFARFRFK